MVLSFFVAFVILLIISLGIVGKQVQAGESIYLLNQTEWWMYLGPLAGLATVYGMIFFPKFIGVSGYIICQTAGQLVTSLILDNFGFIGFTVKPASAMRIVGVVLVCVAAIALQFAKRTVKAHPAPEPSGTPPPTTVMLEELEQPALDKGSRSALPI
jgi:uncharacterized membrane protein YdcZ (DUF606 family)